MQQTITSMLMILNFSYHSQLWISLITSLTLKTLSNISNWMSSNVLSFNPSKPEFLIFCLLQQFSKLNNPTIYLPNNVMLLYVDSACNLGVIFDKNLSFAQNISAVSKSCFHNIRDLRRIRNTIDKTTVCTIATSYSL